MRRCFCLVLLGAILFWGPLAARSNADDSAGAAALARGDFARAESEWAVAATKGDPRAQFGLGETYEQGTGDYHAADHWYTMAAAQGDTDAEYRLMLIWMAGNKDFAPDLAKAYGWMLIATEHGGKSATVDRLGRQFEAHLDDATKAAGRSFATAWDAAHAPPATPLAAIASTVAAPSTAVAGPAPPSPSAAVISPAPASPTAPPASAPQVAVVPTPPPAPDPRAKLDAALKTLSCASIHNTAADNGVTRISGSVTDPQTREALLALAGDIPAGQRPRIDLDVVPPPLCQSIVATDGFVQDGTAAAGIIELSLEGDRVLLSGQPIEVDVKSHANFPTFVRIDYFTLDGQVLHMWPNEFVRQTEIAANGARAFQYRRPNGPDPFWLVSAPFGTELILATATRRRLDLGGSLTEQAADYLRTLTTALRQERAAGRQAYIAATFIHTADH